MRRQDIRSETGIAACLKRMPTARMSSAVAALAVLTAPTAAFLVHPQMHIARAAHTLQQRQPLSLPETRAGICNLKMVGTSGNDISGGDGVYGFTPGGVSKFPAPGNDSRWRSLSRVCVLLFNARTENEGIYTLQLRTHDGVVNTVVLFEEREDGERYAGLLEAQDFPVPQVEALDPREIAAFTADAGYKTTFISSGTLFLPPEENVDPADRQWRPDHTHTHTHTHAQSEESDIAQKLADGDDADKVDYQQARARLERLLGN